VSRPPDRDLERSVRIAYGTGLALCAAWPLALQLLLGTAIRRPDGAPDPLVLQLGYSFTGLVCVGAWFLVRRWHRVRAGFRALAAGAHGRAAAREILLYSAICQVSALFGVAYYALGGPRPEQYGRGFVALATVMFFVFVPRPQAWREAAQGE
jgi:hypothetical protein